VTKNLYEDALESFTYQEVLDGLLGIGTETGRLEVKQEMIAKSKIAHLACAMANADGGIIAIGIVEPNETSPMHVSGKVDISDAMKAGLTQSIHATVYPPIPLTIQGFADGTNSFLIIRIGRTFLGPHEYIKSDDSNLPVKRGSTTGQLSLAEINTLTERRSNIVSQSPYGEPFRKVYLQHEGVNPDFIFGMSIRPVFFAQERRIMDDDDDALCRSVAARTLGIDGGHLHQEFSATILLDSVWLHTPEHTEQGPSGRSAPDQQIELCADGTVLIRFRQQDESAMALLTQYQRLLSTGYVAVQTIYQGFGLSPSVNMHVILRLSAAAQTSEIAQDHDDTFAVNLATQSFADAFLSTTMLMYRSKGRSINRKSVHDELQRFVDTCVPIADELQRSWLS
jgi:hypothetical protein